MQKVDQSNPIIVYWLIELSYVSSTPIAEVDIGLERTAAIRASTHAVGRWLLETCLRWRIV